MIVSNLQNSQRVEGLHPLFKTLFDYVKTHDLFHAELGRIEIDGDNLFINNVNPVLHVTSKFWNYIAIILMYIFCWKVLRLLVGRLSKI